MLTTQTDKNRYLAASHKTLGEIVQTQGRRFVIPLNQRPWAWSDGKNVPSLLDDFYRILTSFYDPNSSPRWMSKPSVQRPPHFFGTFVFHTGEEKKSFEIFDGQQRLTAVTMMCAIMREAAYDIQKTSISHQQVAADLVGAFNAWLRVNHTSVDPRLVPNTHFWDLFSALIYAHADDQARQKALQALSPETINHSVTKKLRKSFDAIHKWIFNNLSDLSVDEKVNFLTAGHDVLFDKFVCIETTILDEPYAYEVFGCLNARGEKLSPGDTIKNEIFAAANREDHAHISNRWASILDNIPAQDMSEFLRRRYIALYGPCKKNDTHKNIKDNEIVGKNSKLVIDEWYNDSRRLKQILEREANAFHNETIEKLDVIFNVLGIGLAYIPLLSASRKFLPLKKDEFHACVNIIENYVFRSITVGNSDTSDVEKRLGEIARKLESGEPISEIKLYLQQQSDDTSFKNAFSIHVERRAKVQYYILKALETKKLGGGKGLIPGNHHSAKNHVEHILPRNLSQDKTRAHEWLWARSDGERHQNLVNRLGNLMILESDINKQVGNHEFSVKQSGDFLKVKSGKKSKIKCYLNSTLPSALELSDCLKYPDWGEYQIIERQKNMSLDALSIWSLK